VTAGAWLCHRAGAEGSVGDRPLDGRGRSLGETPGGPELWQRLENADESSGLLVLALLEGQRVLQPRVSHLLGHFVRSGVNCVFSLEPRGANRPGYGLAARGRERFQTCWEEALKANL